MTIQEAAKANETQAVRCLKLDKIIYDVGKLEQADLILSEVLAEWEIVPPRATITIDEAMRIVGEFWPSATNDVYTELQKRFKYEAAE